MMIRSAALLVAVSALPSAGLAQTDSTPVHHHHHYPRHTRHSHHAAAAPPAPAASAATTPAANAGTQPAPVPNEDVADVPPGQAPATHVTPSLLQLHYPNVGDGYIAGSSPQEMDDRNAAKAPGVEVQVPLKQ